MDLRSALELDAGPKEAADIDTILLSGASGMLGVGIRQAAAGEGLRVLRLVRREARDEGEIEWDPRAHATNTQQLAERISGKGKIIAAVHLSGANVAAHRWTAEYKREMWESRVETTLALSQMLADLKTPPKVLLSASAIGLYGDRGDAVLNEDSRPGEGFFPELCTAWEAAAKPAEDAGIRAVHLRFGVVIGAKGGVLGRLKPMFKWGLGGKIGTGKQWMSWVSEADAVAAVLFAMRSDAHDGGTNMPGAVNVVSPQPVTNAEFTRELGKAMHRPALLPAPAFALRIAFGQMADEALLASTRAIPKRLLEAGFKFRHPRLSDALDLALRD
jgi:uncharacterized protein (TIGR01777 family)